MLSVHRLFRYISSAVTWHCAVATESSGRWTREKGSGADTGQRKWENRDENGVGRCGISAERQRGNRQQVNWNKCRQTWGGLLDSPSLSLSLSFDTATKKYSINRTIAINWVRPYRRCAQRSPTLFNLKTNRWNVGMEKRRGRWWSRY